MLIDCKQASAAEIEDGMYDGIVLSCQYFCQDIILDDFYQPGSQGIFGSFIYIVDSKFSEYVFCVSRLYVCLISFPEAISFTVIPLL